MTDFVLATTAPTSAVVAFTTSASLALPISSDVSFTSILGSV